MLIFTECIPNLLYNSRISPLSIRDPVQFKKSQADSLKTLNREVFYWTLLLGGKESNSKKLQLFVLIADRLSS